MRIILCRAEAVGQRWSEARPSPFSKEEKKNREVCEGGCYSNNESEGSRVSRDSSTSSKPIKTRVS